MKIAITHPGKFGDVLYSLPIVKWLCDKHNCCADFWTSYYCVPLKRLLEYQPYIDSFLINYDYKIKHTNSGVQPWKVPVPEIDYSQIYHLGFKTVIPPNPNLLNFMAKDVGAPNNLPIQYKFPKIETAKKYIIVAPRAQTLPVNENIFIDIIKKLSKKFLIVQVGGKGDFVGKIGKDLTGLDFLETTSWLAGCVAFVGCRSSQLVLAEGFNIPRFILQDGHILSSEQILEGLKSRLLIM